MLRRTVFRIKIVSPVYRLSLYYTGNLGFYSILRYISYGMYMYKHKEDRSQGLLSMQ